jgi:hypothetical protein
MYSVLVNNNEVVSGGPGGISTRFTNSVAQLNAKANGLKGRLLEKCAIPLLYPDINQRSETQLE